jgi:hypothetical protein
VNCTGIPVIPTAVPTLASDCTCKLNTPIDSAVEKGVYVGSGCGSKLGQTCTILFDGCFCTNGFWSGYNCGSRQGTACQAPTVIPTPVCPSYDPLYTDSYSRGAGCGCGEAFCGGCIGACRHITNKSCQQLINEECIGGTPTPTATPTKKLTVTPTKKPTATPTSPVNTVTPGTCKECPGVFNCYKNSSEFKWFVTGYVMDGFAAYIPETVSEPCGGVPKPTFMGKSKGDANCDGSIDVVDFSLWHKEFFDGDKGTVVKPNYWSTDFTGPEGKCDGKVDIYDFSLWQKNFSELK